MTHAALGAGKKALVTGAASGIGLAACKQFANLGMKVCMVDLVSDGLAAARDEVARKTSREDDIISITADVADANQVNALGEEVSDKFGHLHVLMNNAATRTGGGVMAPFADWQDCFDVNFWGVINGVNAFLPGMLAHGEPALVINTGSKQGITNPPGNAAYNATKAALKSYTESLCHELRNTEGCKVSAHLLIPGWTTTGGREHQPGAWLPHQVIDFMMEALERGDFYILCPDNEVTHEMDCLRIHWGAGDITENRPPLSRWHSDFKQAFEEFSKHQK